MYNSNNIAERIKALAKQRGISLAALLLDADLGRNTMAHFKTSITNSRFLRCHRGLSARQRKIPCRARDRARRGHAMGQNLPSLVREPQQGGRIRIRPARRAIPRGNR